MEKKQQGDCRNKGRCTTPNGKVDDGGGYIYLILKGTLSCAYFMLNLIVSSLIEKERSAFYRGSSQRSSGVGVEQVQFINE